MSLRIAIAAQGRFWMFDLARGLLELGHDVSIYTNAPRVWAARHGLPPERVRTNLLHGAATRFAQRMGGHTAEAFLHRSFGQWLAREIGCDRFDTVHLWSSIASEWLARCAGGSPGVLHRGSTHIRAQRALLDEEEQRCGRPIDKPTDWMIAREENEYARARLIIVPSTFNQQTFIERGVPSDRVAVVPFGWAHGFSASASDLRSRFDRLRTRQPLRVLYVGTISYRKGMYDFEQIVRGLPADRFEFRAVGPIAPECAALSQRLGRLVDFKGRVAQRELPPHYAWADLFLLPSIEEGLALVLTQAAAAGLPCLASTHSGGADLIARGAVGWTLPPRAAARWIERLNELEQNRTELMDATSRAQQPAARTWTDVARELTAAVARAGQPT